MHHQWLTHLFACKKFPKFKQITSDDVQEEKKLM